MVMIMGYILYGVQLFVCSFIYGAGGNGTFDTTFNRCVMTPNCCPSFSCKFVPVATVSVPPGPTLPTALSSPETVLLLSGEVRPVNVVTSTFPSAPWKTLVPPKMTHG